MAHAAAVLSKLQNSASPLSDLVSQRNLARYWDIANEFRDGNDDVGNLAVDKASWLQDTDGAKVIIRIDYRIM